MNSPNIAIFDLDYTLTKRGTWGRFVISVIKYRPWVWVPLALSAGLRQILYKAGILPRIAVKQGMMRWSMRGLDRDVLTQHAQRFAQKEVASGLRSGAIRTLENHQKAGDHILVASAAVDLIASEIAALLNIDHVIATRIHWNEKGQLSREFASNNCYGKEKAKRIQEFIRNNPSLKHSHTVITFYSDSHSDLESFKLADVGVAVNPNAKLRKIAAIHGIKIEDWN